MGARESISPAPMPTIGVFDSGFGGLTVLRALLELVPGANYIYFGDTARLPYGSKSLETVARYAVEAAKFIESQRAELLVIACNTATALALDQITDAAQIPVVGVVDPGAAAAAAASRNQQVVVIGTEATVSSHAYRKALESRGLQAREKACPLLVPLVEEGWIDHTVTEQVARIYLQEAFADGFEHADTLVLGCTHYPLIRPLLQRLAPRGLTIVDSAESTASMVCHRLGISDASLLDTDASQTLKPNIKFFATDSVDKFRRFGPRFLGHPVKDVQHVDLKE